MDELILAILSSEKYHSISYYTYHLPFPLHRHFAGTKWNGVQNYLRPLVDETNRLIQASGISQEKIIQYLANDISNPSYLFVAQAILVYSIPIKLDDKQRFAIATKQASLPEGIHVDDEILACTLTCYVLDGNRYSQWDFNTVVSEEYFNYHTNDYYLSKVENVDFKQNGFICDNKYYQYSIFIDRLPLNAGEPIPAVFKIIQDDVDIIEADFLFRLDERLAIDVDKADITHYELSEKFYGPSFLFSETRLERAKSITIHYDPQTYYKLLMVIKRDYDKILDEEFWHIEVEQLPSITTKKKDKFVLTTFVHGKYYPRRRAFRHIDFTKNQYNMETYIQKHNGCSSSDISIDFYTETKNQHYKIWCIENTDMAEELWYKLILVTLPPRYRYLFNEILERCNGQL